jgi:hypothetical protein
MMNGLMWNESIMTYFKIMWYQTIYLEGLLKSSDNFNQALPSVVSLSGIAQSVKRLTMAGQCGFDSQQ